MIWVLKMENRVNQLLEILTRQEGYPDNSTEEDFVEVLVNGCTQKRMYWGWLEG